MVKSNNLLTTLLLLASVRTTVVPDAAGSTFVSIITAAVKDAIVNLERSFRIEHKVLVKTFVLSTDSGERTFVVHDRDICESSSCVTNDHPRFGLRRF